RWKEIGVTSKYLDNRRERFTLEVCNEAIIRKEFFTNVFLIDGNLASYNLGFRKGGTVFDWNTSFSLDYRQLSPGALLQLYTLSNFMKLGFDKYNFLKGDEEYKFIWTNLIENTFTLRIMK